MEFLFALAIMLLAGLGLAVGLMLTGRPPQGSCGGLSCVAGARCDGCPNHASTTEDHDG